MNRNKYLMSIATVFLAGSVTFFMGTLHAQELGNPIFSSPGAKPKFAYGDSKPMKDFGIASDLISKQLSLHFSENLIVPTINEKNSNIKGEGNAYFTKTNMTFQKGVVNNDNHLNKELKEIMPTSVIYDERRNLYTFSSKFEPFCILEVSSLADSSSQPVKVAMADKDYKLWKVSAIRYEETVWTKDYKQVPVHVLAVKGSLIGENDNVHQFKCFKTLQNANPISETEVIQLISETLGNGKVASVSASDMPHGVNTKPENDQTKKDVH